MPYIMLYSFLTHKSSMLPSYHTKTTQLICRANQLTGLYMMSTLKFNKFLNFNQLRGLHKMFREIEKWHEK